MHGAELMTIAVLMFLAPLIKLGAHSDERQALFALLRLPLHTLMALTAWVLTAIVLVPAAAWAMFRDMAGR